MGKEHGRVYDGNIKQSQGRVIRRKFGRESQAAGDELYRGKSRLGKESAARACSERAGKLAGYVTGLANDPEKDGEEENAAGN